MNIYIEPEIKQLIVNYCKGNNITPASILKDFIKRIEG
jgi:hypothetical protein